jgi:hypothetical protein
MQLTKVRNTSKKEGNIDEREGTIYEKEDTITKKEGRICEKEGRIINKEGIIYNKEDRISKKEGTIYNFTFLFGRGNCKKLIFYVKTDTFACLCVFSMLLLCLCGKPSFILPHRIIGT